MNKAHDPKTGAQKVTNTDEQEVVVNHSTVQEGGYDEPTNQQEAEQAEQPPEKLPKEKKTAAEQPRKPQPGADRKRAYNEEEAE